MLVKIEDLIFSLAFDLVTVGILIKTSVYTTL